MFESDGSLVACNALSQCSFNAIVIHWYCNSDWIGVRWVALLHQPSNFEPCSCIIHPFVHPCSSEYLMVVGECDCQEWSFACSQASSHCTKFEMTSNWIPCSFFWLHPFFHSDGVLESQPSIVFGCIDLQTGNLESKWWKTSRVNKMIRNQWKLWSQGNCCKLCLWLLDEGWTASIDLVKLRTNRLCLTGFLN